MLHRLTKTMRVMVFGVLIFALSGIASAQDEPVTLEFWHAMSARLGKTLFPFSTVRGIRNGFKCCLSLDRRRFIMRIWLTFHRLASSLFQCDWVIQVVKRSDNASCILGLPSRSTTAMVEDRSNVRSFLAEPECWVDTLLNSDRYSCTLLWIASWREYRHTLGSIWIGSCD